MSSLRTVIRRARSALVEYGGDYTITQTDSTTANTITVMGGTHTITLNGVNIDVSGMHDGDQREKGERLRIWYPRRRCDADSGRRECVEVRFHM